jgi:hypothetical protein
MNNETRVLFNKVSVPFGINTEIGEKVYQKESLRDVPFSVYHKIESLSWLKDKNFRVIRETRMDHSFNEWLGTEFVVNYFIEFENERDALEFKLRYE